MREYTSNPPLWQWMAGYAAGRGLGMHVHVSETRSEHESCLQKYGKTPVALLDQYGVLGQWRHSRPLRLGERRGHGADGPAGITAVHNPVSNLEAGLRRGPGAPAAGAWGQRGPGHRRGGLQQQPRPV